MLLVGEGWIRRKGRSPEFYDSLIITLWVCSASIDYPFLYAEWPGVGHRYGSFNIDTFLTQVLHLSKHVHGTQGEHLVGQRYAAHVSQDLLDFSALTNLVTESLVYFVRRSLSFLTD